MEPSQDRHVQAEPVRRTCQENAGPGDAEANLSRSPLSKRLNTGTPATSAMVCRSIPRRKNSLDQPTRATSSYLNRDSWHNLAYRERFARGRTALLGRPAPERSPASSIARPATQQPPASRELTSRCTHPVRNALTHEPRRCT